jgi:hypothetical protein
LYTFAQVVVGWVEAHGQAALIGILVPMGILATAAQVAFVLAHTWLLASPDRRDTETHASL